MAGLEDYHGNEEDVYVKGKKQKPSVYKNTVHETLPDPETENEKPGVDIEDWNEEYKNETIDNDLEEEFDHVGDPNDDRLLAIEREELMKKYDDTLGKNNVEDQNDFVADLSDESTELKRESMSAETKRRFSKYAGDLNVKLQSKDKKTGYTINPKATLEYINSHKEELSSSDKDIMDWTDEDFTAKESIQEVTKNQPNGRKRGPLLGRDNLKTMPDKKKQRTFGQRIKAFLLGQKDV